MDFLDPRKKRAYRIRLMVGYVLIAITIGMVTYLLAKYVSGDSYDAKSHSIVQRGLLFIDSRPGGAAAQLSGASSHNTTTSARLVLPAGDYILKLSKDGYRDWKRSFTLKEHAVARYVYPFLFPLQPTSLTMHVYKSLPPLITESPDQHWLLVQNPSTAAGKVSFDIYDTTKLSQPSQTAALPAGLLTKADSAGSRLSQIEWSSDNKHLLLKHRYKGGNEFILFSRDNPSSSINVNKLFDINPSQVALRDKKIDQLYIFDQTAQTLRVGDIGKAVLDPIFLKHVLAFKAYGSDLLTYITTTQMPAGQAQARIWNNGPTYPLRNISAGSHYLIDAAQFQGNWYYVAGSDTNDRVEIFKDPLSSLKDPALGKAIPLLALRVAGASKISFSNNNRFVEIEAGQSFGVYDFETQTRYQYSLKVPLTTPMHWMDGHRLIGRSGHSALVTDYDGTNQQLLTPTVMADGGYFSKEYKQLFTLTSVASSSLLHLDNLDMRAGNDLPKISQ